MHFPEGTVVRTATEADLGTILGTLGDAFADDPVMQWVTRKPTYPRFAFELTVPFCLGQGQPRSLLRLAMNGPTLWLMWRPAR